MNVLYIIWSLDQGGAERVVLDLAKNADRAQFNITICCLNQKGFFANELEQLGTEVIALHKLPKLDPFIIYKISRVISKKKIDIVITHLWTSNFWGRIAAYLSRVKIIIATEHTTDEKRPWYYHLADRFLARISSRIIAVSSSVKVFHHTKSKIPPRKFEIINNGIDIEKFNISFDKNKKRKEFGFKDNDYIIGLFGRFVPAKAHELLLQSLKNIIKAHPQVKVLFAGSGPTVDIIKKLAADLGLAKHVAFAGFRSDIPELYQILDLFVLPSRREGFPITVLEAMASGIPAIVTDVGGNKEIISDGIDGFIIQPNNTEELTQKINFLIDNTETAKKIAQFGQKNVRENFTSVIMTKKTEQLLSGIFLKEGAPRRKTKLLLIIDHLDPGGAQRQIIELVKRLPRAEFQITVCNLDGTRAGLAREIQESDIPVHSIYQSGFIDLKALFSLYKFIKDNSFDIVHTYLFTADTYGRIAAVCARIPSIITSLRSVDTWKNRLHILTDRILACFTDRILVNVHKITSFLICKEQINPKIIRTIYNGIDLKNMKCKQPAVAVRKNLTLDTHDQLVGIFARNDPVKDHITFFKAAKIILSYHKNVTFLAMGDGMTGESIQSILDELDIEQGIILKDHSVDYLDYINAVDVSVLTSVVEGCSNVILESMALCKPVVATAVGGNPELVVEGKTGFLVPPNDPEKLARAIIKILEDPELGEYFGKNGQQRVKEIFSMEKMINDTVLTYRNVLKNKKLINDEVFSYNYRH